MELIVGVPIYLHYLFIYWGYHGTKRLKSICLICRNEFLIFMNFKRFFLGIQYVSFTVFLEAVCMCVCFNLPYFIRVQKITDIRFKIAEFSRKHN